MEPGGDEQALHLRGHGAQDERAVAAAGPAVRSHDDAESGGVPRVELAEVEYEVPLARVDRGVQDGAGVRGAPDIEAASYGEHGVVAPDMHSRSRGF
ncbi:hypothetical protein GCM10012280_43570 [Wenjunlia tyrosinilytica]|uniref:Uncharacterized protein n=1 Tax=Wenjunlia tyrosinilytica TaxID=1544741 RepID=A0A917ZUL2_9ACTN|nr:hypothetical protein GCM10012280_43570 [Wenjunlia tyrosinilytica]